MDLVEETVSHLGKELFEFGIQWTKLTKLVLFRYILVLFLFPESLLLVPCSSSHLPRKLLFISFGCFSFFSYCEGTIL